ncbi:hypothetical protein JRQ81_019829 [Phrynocephalus forsythii]|uniref:Type 2 lactosamine alpha-2,3-sialyltransferase n=1 Tax=Phrynocephalus forsythii TaxID=171643 RepID=A0A9Q1AYN9_9SAUR|nr:hypothetical protein JRQ81_019829 [Phrynocephalus forsythii]
MHPSLRRPRQPPPPPHLAPLRRRLPPPPFGLPGDLGKGSALGGAGAGGIPSSRAGRLPRRRNRRGRLLLWRTPSAPLFEGKRGSLLPARPPPPLKATRCLSRGLHEALAFLLALADPPPLPPPPPLRAGRVRRAGPGPHRRARQPPQPRWSFARDRQPARHGMSVMRRIILVIFLAAGIMYVILLCNLWKTNNYWLPPTDSDRRDQLIACTTKPSVAAFIKFDTLYPFLCTNNFLQVSEQHGNHKFELPYGIMKAEQFFQMALSRLSNCGLFPEDNSNPSCKKCVVVGNGGVLRNKSLGETIDSYDVIIRMNNGPVVGYEGDVGRRTTFRLFYPESVFADPVHYDPNTTAVLVAFKTHDLKWLKDLLSGQRLIRTYAFWKKPAMQLIYKPHQIRILDPAITRRTAHDLLRLPTKFSKHEKPKHPTTGLIAITFAFQICSEVHLAGFKYKLEDRNSSLHYYGNDTMFQMAQNEYHDIAAEQRFLKELLDRKIITNLIEE